MAKKRKKTDAEKEEREYTPPEFDEREFIAEEINLARAVILGAILSIPMGVVAFFVMLAFGTIVGLIAGLAGIFLIKITMPLFKVDEILFRPKHWLSVISTYFFAFLAVWILMVNQPFGDFAAPQFVDVEVQVGYWDNTTISNFDLNESYILYDVLDMTDFKIPEDGIDEENNTFTIDDDETDNFNISEAFVTITFNRTNATNTTIIVTNGIGQASDLNINLGNNISSIEVSAKMVEKFDLIELPDAVTGEINIDLDNKPEITIKVIVTDNMGVAFVNVNISEFSEPVEMTKEDYNYTYSFEPTTLTTVTIYAEDAKKNSHSFEIKLNPV